MANLHQLYQTLQNFSISGLGNFLYRQYQEGTSDGTRKFLYSSPEASFGPSGFASFGSSRALARTCRYLLNLAARVRPRGADGSKWPLELLPKPQPARNDCSSPPQSRSWLEKAARARAEYSKSANRICPGAAACPIGAAPGCAGIPIGAARATSETQIA